KALAGQIAPLEVTCKQSDAKVTLDGADLLQCPATVEKNVLAADHQLVTVKPGYETDTRTIRLAPGKKTTLVIELHPLAAARKLVRRWNRWLPWTVVGTGAAAALAGVPMLLVARSNIHTWDADFAADCPDGCMTAGTISSSLTSTRSKAYLERDIATGLFIGGGVAIAVGVALVVANQPHFEHAPFVAPQVGADRVGVTISGRW
ncbi:MAG: PEGA domain-containing protein, partial [Acidobacteriota bacterium]